MSPNGSFLPKSAAIFIAAVFAGGLLANLLIGSWSDQPPTVIQLTGAPVPEGIAESPRRAGPGASTDEPMRPRAGPAAEQVGRDGSVSEAPPLERRAAAGPRPVVPGADEPARPRAVVEESGPSSEQAWPTAEDGDDEPVLHGISGWVLDQDGVPVEHIEVSASGRRIADGSGPARLGGAAERALTDEDGFFAFEDLPDGEYLLETEATEDYDSVRMVVRAGVTSVTLAVTGEDERTVVIHGTVTDAGGRPIAGARVAPTGEARATTTDGAGAYGLTLTVDGRSRTRSIRFTKAGFDALTRGISPTELHEAADYRLDAALEASGGGALVRGIVMGAGHLPLAGARVQLSSRGRARIYHAVTASDGSFAIADAEVGDDYRLWVRPTARYQDYVEEGLRIAHGGPRLAVFLEPLGTGGIRGRMVDAFGRPVPRYTIWMWNSAPGADRSLPVTGDRKGRFHIERIPAGDVTFGSVGHPELFVGGIELESARTVDVELVLDWGEEQIAGLVVDSAGEPVGGAEVRLSWSDEAPDVTSRSRRRTITDGSGYFLFSELGPAPHTIAVSAAGYRAVRREAMPSMLGGEVTIELKETGS